MRARSTDFFSVFGRIKKSVFKSVVMLKMAEITCERMILTAALKISLYSMSPDVCVASPIHSPKRCSLRHVLGSDKPKSWAHNLHVITIGCGIRGRIYRI